MEYCLIDDWNHKIQLPKKSIAVAISPTAATKLESEGIEYLILEDFHKIHYIPKTINKNLITEIENSRVYNGLAKLFRQECLIINFLQKKKLL